MRIITSIFILIFSTSLFAGWYKDNLDKLVKANGMAPVKLAIDKQSELEADSPNRTIYFNPDALEQACGNNVECIQGLMAHELAHIWYGHVGSSNKRIELLADVKSVTLLKNAGMNPCSMIIGLKIFQRQNGDGPFPTHPNYSVRIKAVEKECKK